MANPFSRFCPFHVQTNLYIYVVHMHAYSLYPLCVALLVPSLSFTSTIGTIFHPQGLILMYQAIMQASTDRLNVPNVPLAMVASPKLLGSLLLPPNKPA